MKRRYVTRPKAWEQYVDYPERDVRDGESLTVYEGAPKLRPTGILDASGEPVLAYDDGPLIGFLAEDL